MEEERLHELQEAQDDMLRELEKLELKGSDDTSEGQSPNASNAPLKGSVMEDKHQGESSILPKKIVESSDTKPITNTSAEKPSAEQPECDHHKRSGDAVAAAKEQFLARKKAKEH
nr:hypothetical protein CFP56_50144 [Quercus suber]